jgi:ribosomal protein L29
MSGGSAMKFVDLLRKDAKELCQMCVDLKREHMNLRILSKTTQDVKTAAIRVCKKNIARVKTRLSQLKKVK